MKTAYSFVTLVSYRDAFVLMMEVFVSADTVQYRGADKCLARPTSPCILFDGENIPFDASLVLYMYVCVCVCMYSTNIPPIMIINMIYETQNLLSL